MILFLHNRYRTTGGEERVVGELMALVRKHLDEPAELLERDSAGLGGVRATTALLRGGVAPREVAKAVRLTGARVVHAHNLGPLFGWRALAAAREQGARVVLHLHQYRLVCATGVCFTGGQECTRCQGRNTLPGVIHNCRGSRAEALAYGASLALWQGRLVEQADVVIVPSEFARKRLQELGAPLDFEQVQVLAPPVRMPEERAEVKSGAYALVVSRLAPEKGVDVAIEACRLAGVPLVVAGDGPEGDALRAGVRDAKFATPHARVGQGKMDDLPAQVGYAKFVAPHTRVGQDEAEGLSTEVGHANFAAPHARVGQAETDGPSTGAERGEARFVGRVGDDALERLRAGAALAIVPSRSAETFGMAAAEAMAAGVPVVASRIGALPELVEEPGLVDPGDATALAEAIGRLWGDAAAGGRGRARVSELCSPEVVAEGLEAVYGTNRSTARRA